MGTRSVRSAQLVKSKGTPFDLALPKGTPFGSVFAADRPNCLRPLSQIVFARAMAVRPPSFPLYARFSPTSQCLSQPSVAWSLVIVVPCHYRAPTPFAHIPPYPRTHIVHDPFYLYL